MREQQQDSSLKTYMSLGVFLLSFVFLSTSFFRYPYIFAAALLANLATGYIFERNKNKREASKKGLTLEDLRNIKFTKKWALQRENGLIRYLVIDGIIIGATLLSIALTFITYQFLWPELHVEAVDSLDTAFKLIICTYLSSVVLSLITCRILWNSNEKRFKRLTDPLSYLT